MEPKKWTDVCNQKACVSRREQLLFEIRQRLTELGDIAHAAELPLPAPPPPVVDHIARVKAGTQLELSSNQKAGDSILVRVDYY